MSAVEDKSVCLNVMEEFDFSTKINATVVFDDSDDETTPNVNDLETATQTNKQELSTSDAKTLGSHKIKQKEPDMPSLEDENSFSFDNLPYKCYPQLQNDNVSSHNLTAVSKISKGKKSKKSNNSSIEDKNCQSRLSSETDLYKYDCKLKGKIIHISKRRLSKETVLKTNPQESKKGRKSAPANKISDERLGNETNHNVNINGEKPVRRKSNNIEVTQSNTQYNSGLQLPTNIDKVTSFSQPQEVMNYLQNRQTPITTNKVPFSQADQINNEQNNIPLQIQTNTAPPFSHGHDQINNQNSIQLQVPTGLSEIQDKILNVTCCLQSLLDTISENMITILNLYYNLSRIRTTETDRVRVDSAENQFISYKRHLFDLSYSSVVSIIIPRENDSEFVRNFLTNTIEIAQIKTPYVYPLDMQQLFFEMINWVKRKQQFVQHINRMPLQNKDTSSSLIVQQLNRPPAVPQLKNKGPPPQYSSPRNKKNPNTESITPHLYSADSAGTEVSMYSDPNGSIGNNTDTRRSLYDDQRIYKEKGSNYVNNAYAENYNRQDVPNRLPSWQSVAPTNWQNESAVNQNCPENYQYNTDSSKNAQSYRKDNPPQPEQSRSSISRDSGFMSPINFNNNEQSFNLQGQDQTMQPLITHVTSLNPNVAYIIEGPCHICGKATKKKCLGCYKCYYCSHECQIRDWKNHVAICK